MAGDYVEFNLPDENNYARLFYQANIGYQLSSKFNLWAETVSSRHILAQKQPLVSIITTSRVRWRLIIHLIMKPVPDYIGKAITENITSMLWCSMVANKPTQRKEPSLGFQFTWNPVNYFSFNYSNYYEKNKESIYRLQRVFHNFFITSHLSPTVDMIGALILDTIGIDFIMHVGIQYIQR